MTSPEALDGSAPRLAPRTPEFQRALDALTREVELLARTTPRHGRRVAAIAGTSVATVGLSAIAAAAAGITPSWIPWSTGASNHCRMLFVAQPKASDGEPARIDYDAAQQQRASQQANRFLAGFDYSSVDERRAIEEFQRAEDAAIRSEAAGEKQPRLTGDDLTISAVGGVVWKHLEQELIADGFARPADAITFQQFWTCP